MNLPQPPARRPRPDGHGHSRGSVQAEHAAQFGQVLGQRVDAGGQDLAVAFGELVIGDEAAVLGPVFLQGVEDRLEVLLGLVQEGLVLAGDQRLEQLDDLVGAFEVGLEVPQVGVAVAVFLTGDLGGGHFFHQHGCTAHHFLGREGQVGQAFVQLLDIGLQLLGVFDDTLGVLLVPQGILDAVEAAEARVLLTLLVVVGTRVDGDVDVAKQLGDRLDALIVGAHGGEQLLGLFDLAGLDGSHEDLGVLYQGRNVLVDEQLVFGDGANQLAGLDGGLGADGAEGSGVGDQHGDDATAKGHVGMLLGGLKESGKRIRNRTDSEDLPF